MSFTLQTYCNNDKINREYLELGLINESSETISTSRHVLDDFFVLFVGVYIYLLIQRIFFQLFFRRKLILYLFQLNLMLRKSIDNCISPKLNYKTSKCIDDE